MQATYSPEDNKLRLYSSTRLDAGTYARVKAAGFKWAPRQELFVAPMWTPGRADLLLELCGEIGDEDTTLTERAEDRAARFDDYGEKRLADAARARDAVAAIADGIPFGQPILVGHHSERRARRDAERIKSGMNKTVRLWETSKYWVARAAGAVAHAKYKELPAVRARRIKGLESDARKFAKQKTEAEKRLAFWSRNSLTREIATAYANVAESCGDTITAPDGKRFSAWSALQPDRGNMDVAEVARQRRVALPAVIEHWQRWLDHTNNRLLYERTMLGEAGGLETDKKGPEVGGAVRCWQAPGHTRGGWAYVCKVNRVSVSVRMSYSGDRGRTFPSIVPLDKVKGVMTRAEVEQARADGRLTESGCGCGFYLAEIGTPPAEAPRAPSAPTDFDAIKQTLKAGGVQVVTANQLFPTPRDVARQMVARLPGKRASGLRILEPSAGTGELVKAIWDDATGADCVRVVAVEINDQLVQRLEALRNLQMYANSDNFDIHRADFLQCNGDLGKFDAVLMNPPFENGSDIRHVLHARQFLKPGGRLVAICANGPRQQRELQPIADSWEELPAGTFAGTDVRTVLLTVSA
jgi:SAM-dependent methyltransferase